MTLKDKLAQGNLCAGTFVLVCKGADFSAFISTLGFDYLILDMEHTSCGMEEIRTMIQPALYAGVAPIVRIPELRYEHVARALDAGAAGIMLPRVESAEEARTLVQYAKYKPEGVRGFTTFAAQSGFKKPDDPAAYARQRNQEIFLIAQIESAKAVDQAADILAVPGIDCCFVGTNDLAFDMGLAGQTEHPEVEKKIKTCLDVSRRLGRHFSLPVRKPEDIPVRMAAGVKMLTLSSESSLLAFGADAFLGQIQK
ncbi:aldolase/citrate lyase family protein [Kamptonema cortianum]|nr:aldolase/citrate lyase family protein [Oscillatoria laete-virens]MDK3157149.1 aldolase/citrate lyase family protein [Kamptonema cortianum]MDL5051126.1 aldolase/citrate lyase family protein [Oscillatoria amoena NRMC-F 0135]MDL5055032.1 aldolase/citrate lyase family protein [Oscillatoria laete-virens NRMC-F 0139]